MNLETAARPEAPAKDRAVHKKVVILATPQTGSTHLVELLDSHPSIHCLGEIFNPKGNVLRELGLKTRKSVMQAAQEPIAFIEQLAGQQAEQEDGKPVFGFKMMLHHDPRMIDHVIDDPSWNIIVLERMDLLAQWASMAVAKKSGRFDGSLAKTKKYLTKDWDGDEDDEDDADEEIDDLEDTEPAATASSESVRKITFDGWKFEQYCFRMQGRYASIYHRLGKRKYFRLVTESIDESYPKLLEFLGVEPTPLPPTTPFEEPVPMKDRIENFEAFARYAKKHALEIA